VSTQSVSEVENDKEMSAMMKGYDVVNSEGEDERSPPKLELAHQYREYTSNKSTQSPTICRTLPSLSSSSSPPPLLINAMDISSVRIRPVPVKAHAVMTLTHGHPRLNWPAVAKVNTYIPLSYKCHPGFFCKIIITHLILYSEC